MAAPGTIERPEVTDSNTGGAGDWIVTVFNNEYNTWDEVVYILMVATGCSESEADMETWEIDNLGKSVVHYGNKGECDDAAAIIASIGIRVEVTQESVSD
jgi:ATP-dependent Clp protease adapter protein ClpS